MTYRVEISRRAARDFVNLYNSINAEHSVAGARWFNGLQDTILHLETAPRMGAVTHENPTLRQLIYGSKPHFYRVIYKVDDVERVVNIVEIRHGRRQPPSQKPR